MAPTLQVSLSASAAAWIPAWGFHSDFLHLAEAFAQVFFGVAQFDAGLDAVKERRRDGRIALGRQPVEDIAHMDIHAEDFLDDDDTAFRCSVEVHPIRVEDLVVAGREFYGLSHAVLLFGL